MSWGRPLTTRTILSFSHISPSKLGSINNCLYRLRSLTLLDIVRKVNGIEEVFTSQGIDIDVKKTGDFLRWIINDITSEEMDTMVASKLEPKEIGYNESIRQGVYKHQDGVTIDILPSEYTLSLTTPGSADGTILPFTISTISPSIYVC